MESVIPTKLGQAPTDTPRTLASKRGRLGSLFSSMAIANPDTSQGSDSSYDTPSKGSNAGPASSWLSWLSPTKQRYHNGDEVLEEKEGSPDDKGKGAVSVDQERVEGSVDLDLGAGYVTIGERSSSNQSSALLQLPDELLIEIFLRLPPSAVQISTLALVSRRFQGLYQAPRLWSHVFRSSFGSGLLPELADCTVAADLPPKFHWNGVEWISAGSDSTVNSESIPVHWPTLYRSRRALSRIIRCQSPSGPPHRLTLSEHTDSVYCVHLATPWLITGSRDRSIRFWRLEDLPLRPCQRVTSETRMAKNVERAHEGSVLSMSFEMNREGLDGTLVTGSSDMTACVWDVQLGERVDIQKVYTLRGHTSGVLDVALGHARIATCSKDTTIRIYDRETRTHLFTFDKHDGPVNSLSLGLSRPGGNECLVSASGDGYWIMWDMSSGEEIKRGAGEGRGLACIIWEGNEIITGDNDRMVKIFSATDSALLKTFEGHTDLVRSVAIDRRHDMVISGSYDQSVRMWDMKSGNMIRRLRGDHSSLIFGVASDRGRIVS